MNEKMLISVLILIHSLLVDAREKSPAGCVPLFMGVWYAGAPLPGMALPNGSVYPSPFIRDSRRPAPGEKFIGFPQLRPQSAIKQEIIRTLRSQILSEAAWALNELPVTVTSYQCARSAGGKHDFYSEGDYWWADPNAPEGPYVQRDGQTNPDNFVEHRRAMIRLSKIIGALASAYSVTKEEKYVIHAVKHLKAWFADTATRMNPSLLYAQAIKGKVTGRGIGIIDTIHLIEVAQGIRVMETSKGFDKAILAEIKEWFSDYLSWLTTHPYGRDEMNAKNNHGTCWVMQAAAFAKLTGNNALIEFCKDRFKNTLLPGQMAGDGSFPLELNRTKPYGYSLFNLDAMATICHMLSDENENLWNYETSDKRSVKKGIEFLYPYVKDKNQWPYPKDVMYWNNWPVAHPFLVFGALACQNKEWLATWKQLDHSSVVAEVNRNLPIRNPVIWLNEREGH